jgi:hypothetical protein
MIWLEYRRKQHAIQHKCLHTLLMLPSKHNLLLLLLLQLLLVKLLLLLLLLRHQMLLHLLLLDLLLQGELLLLRTGKRDLCMNTTAANKTRKRG